MEKTGRILKGIGGFYYVDVGEAVVECRARGKFRKLGLKPLAGDVVSVALLDDGTGYLMELMPRRNQLIRPPVSNLDQIVIIASEAAPVTDPFLIDRVSAIACHMGISVAVVANKCDLEPGSGLVEIYQKAGFTAVSASGETGQGIEQLLDILRGKFSAFTGNSGVGKSTLLNRICPGLGLQTGSINDKIGRGRHTTRQVEIFKISEGTWVADTPGFSSFDTERMDLVSKDALQYAFPEFRPYLDKCRFTGCAHVKDKGCAVLQALDSGEISQSRYDSYVKMYESMKEIREWEKRGQGDKK